MLRSIPATLLPSFGLPVHGGDKASRGTSGKIVHPRSYLCIPYMLFVTPRPHCLYHLSGHFRHSFVRVAATEQWMNQKTSGGVSLFPRESGQKISLRYPVHPSDHSCTPLSPGQRSVLGLPHCQSEYQDPKCVQSHSEEAEGLRSLGAPRRRFLKPTQSQRICLLLECPPILPHLNPCCYGDHQWD